MGRWEKYRRSKRLPLPRPAKNDRWKKSKSLKGNNSTGKAGFLSKQEVTMLKSISLESSKKEF